MCVCPRACMLVCVCVCVVFSLVVWRVCLVFVGRGGGGGGGVSTFYCVLQLYVTFIIPKHPWCPSPLTLLNRIFRECMFSLEYLTQHIYTYVCILY